MSQFVEIKKKDNLPFCIIVGKGEGIEMSISKVVNFNFFRPCTTEEGRTVLLNLTDLFETVRLRYLNAKENNETDYKVIYSYNDEPARLSEISVDPSNGIYHLIFERLTYILPNRTTLHGDSTAVELDEEEFIGHEVSVLYDSEHHILMVQRNRASLSPSGIEICLHTLVNKFEVTSNFDLAIISDPEAKRRAIRQSSYRKIHMKVTGAKADGLIEKFWGKKNTGIDNVEIVLSSGLKKDDEINNQFAKEILEDYMDDREVKGLKIRAREYEGELVEPIDLIDHKVQRSASLSLDDSRQINPYRIYDEMVALYIGEERGVRNKLLRM